jgi:LCP family protein required for cell wall assembly
VGKHLAPGDPKPAGYLQKFTAGALVVLMLGVGILAGIVTVQSIVLKRPWRDVAVSDLSPFNLIEPPQAHFKKDRIAVLLLGIDYNYDNNDQEFSSSARSDTIMTLSLNFPTAQNPTGSVGILSVPRDMDVVMPDGHEDKINAAYTISPDPGKAAKNSEKIVAEFLGIPGFDRYVTLRIDATKELVDAIGGIDVVPDETMNYDDSWGHLHIHFTGGKQYHMNGEQAVSYSRFRHDECGDPCRIKRQQQVLRIVIAKLKNDKFNDFMHITQLVGVVKRNVYTNLSDREILSLANAFKSIDLSAVKTEQVPYVADKDLACCGNVIIADDSAKNDLVKKIFLNPIAPSVLADPSAVAAVKPSSIHVVVLNGSGVPGMAKKMAAVLGKQGFVVQRVANAMTTGYDSTEIHVHSGATSLAGERVKAALPVKTAVVQPDPSPAGALNEDVTVIVGRDYSNPPQSEASAVK